MAEVVHIRDHPEIRDRPDIMRRIYNAGHRPYFRPKKAPNAEVNRFMKRHPEYLKAASRTQVKRMLDQGMPLSEIDELLAYEVERIRKGESEYIREEEPAKPKERKRYLPGYIADPEQEEEGEDEEEDEEDDEDDEDEDEDDENE